MADDKRFSHITVNASEDDDVVIQAGAYAPVQPEQPVELEEAPADQAQWADAESDAQAEFEVEPEAEEAPEFVEPQPADDDVADDADADTADTATDEYEQTLADLEAGPMSGMQKAVLGGVAVIIVAAVVYFALFMH